uniref:Uncharacterized protein n=1 Tax=Timema monikensis TaxID=170555 RepID=A0A7R9HSD0_9NEOP|nr:unnamed protein product [Timema monikensis]
MLQREENWKEIAAYMQRLLKEKISERDHMESSPETNLKGFSIAFGTTEFLGALAVVMMTVWVGHYRGGYSWSSLEPDLEFNWHPVLMTLELHCQETSQIGPAQHLDAGWPRNVQTTDLEDSILSVAQQAHNTHDFVWATNGHIDSDTSSLISSPGENSIFRSDAEEIGNEVEKRVAKDIHIHSKTNNWYSFLCNRWLSLCGVIPYSSSSQILLYHRPLGVDSQSNTDRPPTSAPLPFKYQNAAVKLLIMFLVHWGYALANIGVVFIVWLYIGHANPAVKPGISAEFKKRVQEYEQIVVTPLHPGVEVISSQMNEENEDFSSRKRYHQSSTIQGYSCYFDNMFYRQGVRNQRGQGHPSSSTNPIHLTDQYFPSMIPVTAKELRPHKTLCSRVSDTKGKKVLANQSIARFLRQYIRGCTTAACFGLLFILAFVVTRLDLYVGLHQSDIRMSTT